MKALRKWRMTLPKEQRSLRCAGALLGVSGPTLSRLEHGVRQVKPNRVNAIARITGIPPTVLRPDVFHDA